MSDDNFSRPGSNKIKQWEFGKRLSEGFRHGETVKSMLDGLNAEYEGTDFKPVRKETASKLKIAHEVYIREYGFTVKDLENVSAYDLYDAQVQFEGVKIVNSKEDAKKLLERLKAGEAFSAIRRSSKALRRTRAEHFIEDVHTHLLLIKTSQSAKLTTVTKLTESYLVFVRAERSNPSQAEQLCREYAIALAKLYIGT